MVELIFWAMSLSGHSLPTYFLGFKVALWTLWQQPTNASKEMIKKPYHGILMKNVTDLIFLRFPRLPPVVVVEGNRGGRRFLWCSWRWMRLRCHHHFLVMQRLDKALQWSCLGSLGIRTRSRLFLLLLLLLSLLPGQQSWLKDLLDVTYLPAFGHNLKSNARIISTDF